MTFARSPAGPDEAGFTLIEVLLSILILGVISSGVGACIILFFKTVDGTGSRLSLSHDSQLLANYLVPDLDSLGPAQPSATYTASPGCGGSSLSDLTISYTGIDSEDLYLVDYTTNGSVMARTFTHQVGGVVQDHTVTTVVHNLKPGYACFGPASGPPPWTMTVTVQATGNSSADYTFSVTGGRIDSFVSGTPPGPPALCPSPCVSLVSKDLDGNGRIDHIIATFDQSLNATDTAGATEWTLPGRPPGVQLSSVTVFGRTVDLALTEGTTVDTVAGGLMVAFTSDLSGHGIRNGSGQPASTFGPTAVSDGMAPVVTGAITSQDLDHDGKVDRVVMTFSEPLAGYSAGKDPWTLSGQPAGVSVSPTVLVDATAQTATLVLNEGTGVDTVAAGFNVAMGMNPAGIQDAAGNLASFGPTPVVDGMAPVLVGATTSQDVDHNGRVDHAVMTFSEPLAPGYSAGNAPWTLSGQPAGVTLASVSVDVVARTATLVLKEGTGIDTVAAGFQVAMGMNPAGIRDGAGNLASVAPTTVADGMAPILTGATSQDADHDGKVDHVVMVFSEPLAGYSAGNAPWTLSGQPPGVSIDNAAVVNDTATLVLHEGTTIDTLAAGLRIALVAKAGGVGDGAGNLTSFAATGVSDGMGPVVTLVESTNASRGTQGDTDTGDTLTLTFSEPLAAGSLPPSPTVTVMATPGASSSTTITIPGVAGIALVLRSSDSVAVFASSLTVGGAAVTIVLGANTNGQEARTVGQMTVTPDATVTDASGNPATGVFSPPGPPTSLF